MRASPDTNTITTPAGGLPRNRFATSFADPVLRNLTKATAISAVSRGVFFALTVLYFTFVVGLSAAEVAIILTLSSAVGVVTALLGGILADRISARRLLLAFVAAEGIALLSYSFATSFVSALAIACVVTAANRGANTVRSAVIGRAFRGSSRVGARAILRTVQNVGVAIGGGLASIPLMLGTPDAYRGSIGIAAALTLASTLVIVRLPRRVDAVRHGKRRSSPSGGVSPWRNPRYVTLTVLSALFGIQFGLAEIGLPLWILHDTNAPAVAISVLLIINTALVIALQIPFSRGTHDIRKAGNAVAIAGACMAIACAIYAATAGVSPAPALALLALAMVAHTFGEILSSAGTWGLSYALADPRRIGEYQGLFAMAFSVGAMFSPLILTVTILNNGTGGWATLALLFLGSALGIRAIARRSSALAASGGDTSLEASVDPENGISIDRENGAEPVAASTPSNSVQR